MITILHIYVQTSLIIYFPLGNDGFDEDFRKLLAMDISTSSSEPKSEIQEHQSLLQPTCDFKRYAYCDQYHFKCNHRRS